jgi:hypothetical protein
MVKYPNENVLGFIITNWINFINDGIADHVIRILTKRISK